MKKMNRHNKLNPGFTLLEVLVAMTLMVVIAMSLYSSMYVATRSKDSIARTIEPYRYSNPAFDFLQKDLACTLAPGDVLAGEFQGVDGSVPGVDGADILLFYTCNYVPGEDEIAGDIAQIEYFIEQKDGWQEPVLVRRRTTNLLSPKTVEGKSEVICRGVKSFNLQYYDGYEWLDTWDSTTREDMLPAAVAIRLTLKKPEVEMDYEEQRNKQLSKLNNSQYTDNSQRTMEKTIILSCADMDGLLGI